MQNITAYLAVRFCNAFSVLSRCYFFVDLTISFTISTIGIIDTASPMDMRKLLSDRGVSLNIVFTPGIYITSVDNTKDNTIAPIKNLLCVFNVKMDFVIDLKFKD